MALSEDYPHGHGEESGRPLTRSEICAAIGRVRAAVEAESLPQARTAAALGRAAASICSRFDPVGRATIAAIAARWHWSEPALEFSLEALCRPFVAMHESKHLKSAQGFLGSKRVIGFLMPGNIPGAGLHEVVAALLAGAGVFIKTATAEPIFFSDFFKTLAWIDSRLQARASVMTWGRSRDDLTRAMFENCDQVVVFGDDDTVADVHRGWEATNGRDRGTFTGFGARVSGAILTRGIFHKSTLRELVGDVVRFEQRGCLSPHHLFVEDAGGSHARSVAELLATELEEIGQRFPPPAALPLEDAAAIRRAREVARWRAIGGQPLMLWEGANLGWTVIYDRDARFTRSPGFRTLYVSPFDDLVDLERRLQPVSGRIEAFAIAADIEHQASLRKLLEALGSSWICAPGLMQSPPIDWPHGGQTFESVLVGKKA